MARVVGPSSWEARARARMLAQAACTFSDESARPARARGLLHQDALPASY